jgi:prepilin-type N-terminal cleavage/methylation domain-containing protein
MTPCNGVKKHSSPGFTLLEVLIVVVFMSIVVMLGWPALNAAMGGSRLLGAAQEVVNAVEFAQLTAMTSGRITRVVISNVADSIGVRQYEINADLFGGGDELVDSDVESGTFELMGNPMNKGAEYKIILPDETRFQGVDITTSDFFGVNALNFDTLGAPSHGGTITLALGGDQVIVSLDALTGKVTVSQ